MCNSMERSDSNLSDKQVESILIAGIKLSAMLMTFAIVWIIVMAFSVKIALGGERIPFSMHDAPSRPVAPQPSFNVSRGATDLREKPAFSMHDAEEPAPTTSARIAFSVHDAKALTGQVNAKPDCAPARSVNRMLVIHPATATIKVKVCDDFGCRYELRTVPHPIVSELKKLSPKWSCGDKECDHFRLVNADDPKQAELVRELQIKRDELPLLIKETDVEKRKKAAGMSGEDIAKLWNKWFVEPEPEVEKAEGSEQKAETQKCLPTFGASGTRWTWPGSIRDHLTDPRQVHHLPRAVVASWSDQQCITWHNWHHEVLSGRRPVAPRQALNVSRGATDLRSSSPLASRIDAIARETIRSPPANMVAAANASYGHSSDAMRSVRKKKRSTLSRNGSLTSENVCGRKLLAASSPSIPSAFSTRSRSFPSSV